MTTASRTLPIWARDAATPPPPTREETVAGLLDASRRELVPIRTSFVQQGHGRTTRPGPLASFLTAHDGRALDAYLLVHAIASARPWSVDLPADVWARALGIEAAKPETVRSGVSKVLRRLDVDHQLIRRQRSKRRSVIYLLDERGDGREYPGHPYSSTRERYLRLPYAYWREAWVDTLTLVGKVMLLIALERDDGFYLPLRKAKAWYGVSEDSAERGLRELHRHGLIDAEHTLTKDIRSTTGWADRRIYTLTGPFSTEARDDAARARDDATGNPTETPDGALEVDESAITG